MVSNYFAPNYVDHVCYGINRNIEDKISFGKTNVLKGEKAEKQGIQGNGNL